MAEELSTAGVSPALLAHLGVRAVLETIGPASTLERAQLELIARQAASPGGREERQAAAAPGGRAVPTPPPQVAAPEAFGQSAEPGGAAAERLAFSAGRQPPSGFEGAQPRGQGPQRSLHGAFYGEMKEDDGELRLPGRSSPGQLMSAPGQSVPPPPLVPPTFHQSAPQAAVAVATQQPAAGGNPALRAALDSLGNAELSALLADVPEHELVTAVASVARALDVNLTPASLEPATFATWVVLPAVGETVRADFASGERTVAEVMRGLRVAHPHVPPLGLVNMAVAAIAAPRAGQPAAASAALTEVAATGAADKARRAAERRRAHGVQPLCGAGDGAGGPRAADGVCRGGAARAVRR